MAVLRWRLFMSAQPVRLAVSNRAHTPILSMRFIEHPFPASRAVYQSHK
jgi:hypothetical protein